MPMLLPGAAARALAAALALLWVARVRPVPTPAPPSPSPATPSPTTPPTTPSPPLFPKGTPPPREDVPFLEAGFGLARHKDLWIDDVFAQNGTTGLFVAVVDRVKRINQGHRWTSVFVMPRTSLAAARFPSCATGRPRLGDPSATCINSTVSLFFNTHAYSYLATKAGIDFEVVPERPTENWLFPRASSTATESKPVGVVLSPPRAKPKPSGRKTGIKEFPDVTDESHTLLANPFAFRAPAVYTGLFASVWPMRVFRVGTTVMGCDGARAVATIGQGFMGLQISAVNHPPLEVIVVPKNTQARMLNRLAPSLQLEPPGPPAGPLYKVYALAYGNAYTGHAMYKTARAVAAFPEESLDYRYHLSQASIEALSMLAEAGRKGAKYDGAYHFYRIVARLATATFALAEVMRLSDYLLLQETIDMDINLRILAPLAMQYASGSSTAGSYVFSDLAFDRSDVAGRQIRRRVAETDPEAASRRPLAEQHRLLRAVYAYADRRLPNAVRLAGDLARFVHLETLMSRMAFNSTVRESLFFAAAVAAGRQSPEKGILVTEPTGPPGEELSVSELTAVNRDILRKYTSMCTAAHVLTAGLKLETALAGLSAGGPQFSLLGIFSPCMASARFDLMEEAHVMDLLSFVPQRLPPGGRTKKEASGEALAAAGRATSAVLGSRMAYSFDAVGAFVPELTSCTKPLPKLLAVLPATQNSSYVITRENPHRGLTYTLHGVNIANPLTVSYISAGDCSVARGTIRAATLFHPGNTRACVYCGSVFMRYVSSGAVMDLIAVDDKETELQLVAGINSTIPAFNPRMYTTSMSALLLFPNGTVVTITTFTAYEFVGLSGAYIWASVGGVLLAVAVLYIIFKMVCGGFFRGDYKALINMD
ncbi:envelope glycoprotein H [Equid alphaherpesvirus 3]|uniref:Envelope glycoprotein H n=1 Tax=Equid alphaherpesvirus 3 TaxID=80341 RepID=A0A077B9C9_9ALPH|nr:envelope glycoprotein H [Equid alphaherpesvirus 3]AIL02957.1 envelope glycoprotein H [Equid alphaherpesvirus 3]